MKKETLILISALLLVGTGVGLVQVLLMPPFQNPDEIQHFLYSASYAYSPNRMETVEARVLEELKKTKWFHFVGIGPGWENTRSISEISFVFHFDTERTSETSARKTLFHFLYGNILKLSGIKGVMPAFYFLRLLSTAFFLIILLLVFWFFKAHYPETWVYYVAGTVLVFQLLTILNAVNYDVLLVLFGVLFFAAAYRYHQNREKKYLAVMLTAALLASLTKLAGVLFFVFLFLLLCLDVKWDLKLMKNFSLVLFIVILGFCWMNYLFPGRFFSLYSVVFGVLRDAGAGVSAAGGKVFRPGLFASMIDSFYFQTGWMGFKLSGIWYLVLKLFLLLSLVGVFAALFIKRLKTSAPEKKWFVFALIVILLQVLGIWLYYGGKTAVQGRYLYPVIIPIIMLVYSGLLKLQKLFHLKRDYIVIFYLLFQVVLTVFAVTRIISVFYLEMASPHPGL